MHQEQAGKETIIARIKKLLKHAKSAEQMDSLEEAEAFSTKANELLIQHNLEMSQIKLDEDDHDPFKNWVYAEGVSFQDNQAGQRWRLNLVNILCKHNLCNYTWNSYSKTFRVYGNMDNVDVVIYMYHFISLGFLRLAQQAHVNRSVEDSLIYGSKRYAFLKDWLLGAVTGLNKKLTKQAQQRSSAITSLVLVNKHALDTYIKEAAPKLKAVKSKPITVGSAYGKGVKVGEGFEVGKKIGYSRNTAAQKQLG